jgi:glycerol-3-phosphate dehydrogenase (NAD(P)+)
MTERTPSSIALIGYGSWATALAHLFSLNALSVDWWVKDQADADYLTTHRSNPRYLVATPLNLDRTRLSTDLEQVIRAGDVIFLVTPSAYLHETLRDLPHDIFAGKTVVSSIKGLDPLTQLRISEYLQQTFGVTNEQFVLVSGPSHAEEVVQGSITYLTVASQNDRWIAPIANCVRTDTLHTVSSNDVIGIEYAGILKNIYTIGVGIALGLGYQDNFIAVFVGACLREMGFYLNKKAGGFPRDITHSAYLGDFLTTAYSPFSRNRKLGYLVGQGASATEAIAQMEMVAEGYHATRIMVETHNLHYAIAQMVFDILYKGTDARSAYRQAEFLLV